MRNKNNIFLHAILCVLMNSFIYGQSFTGSVKDEGGKPIAFSTVMLLSKIDSTFIQGKITDKEGQFVFNDFKKDEYLLKISCLGFKDYFKRIALHELDLYKKTIILYNKENSLSEVILTNQKPIIKLENNKIIIKVDSLITKGNNANDILARSPGVLVYPSTGTISLLGNSNVKIYVNKRLISSNSVNTFLSSINAQDIETIEITSNTTARSDANFTGGIINITLKKKSSGINGDIILEDSQGMFNRFNNVMNLNYVKNNLNAFLSYTYGYKKRFEKTNGKNTFNTFPLEQLDRSTDAVIKSSNHLFKLGLEYSKNKTSLGAVITGDFYEELIPQKNLTKITQDINEFNSETNSLSDNRRQDIAINLDLIKDIDTLGSLFRIDYQFTNFEIKNKGNFSTNFIEEMNEEILTSFNPNSAKVNGLEVEYNKIFENDCNFVLGAKFNLNEIDNEVDFLRNNILDNDLSNSFKYKENINAFYSEFGGVINSKISFVLGVRIENTQIITDYNEVEISEKKYLDYFPSVSTSYNFSNNHQLSFTYSKKIDRPKYNDLNPFLYYIDPYTFIKGNPELEPQYGNYFSLEYLISRKYYVSLFNNKVDNVFIQIPVQNENDFETSLQVNNLESSNQYGISITIPYKNDWLISNTNILVYNKTFNFKTGQSINLSNSRNILEYSQSNTFILPRGIKLDLTGFYVSPFVQGVYEIDSYYSLDLALRKTFFKDNLHAKFVVKDLFYTYRINSDSTLPNQSSTLSQMFDTRRVSLQLIYQFKTGKETKKRVLKNINNDIKKRL